MRSAELKKKKAEDVIRKNNPPGKIYTLEELKKEFFPEDYKQGPYKFAAQRAGREVKVPAVTVDTGLGLQVRVNGKVSVMGKFEIGSYRIVFDGNYYVSKNRLEYNALMNKPGIVCLGAEEVKKAPSQKKDEKPSHEAKKNADKLSSNAEALLNDMKK